MAKKPTSLSDLERTRGVKITPLYKVLFALLLVLVIGAGFFTVSQSISSNSAKLQEDPTSVDQMDRTLSGKSLDEDRADALAAATALLQSAGATQDLEETEATVAKMDSGDFSMLPEDFDSQVRYYDSYAKDEAFKAEVRMSVFTLAAYAKNSAGVNELTPDAGRLSTVRVDQETGIAQVPLELYFGSSNVLSLEMIYVDGQWLLEPHSLTSYIRLSYLSSQQSSE